MLTPALVGSGTGVAVTGTTGTVTKTGCTKGNLVVVHILVNPSGAPTIDTVTNISDLAGVANALTADPSGGGYQVGATEAADHFLRWGRVTADGTCSVDFTIAAGVDAFARIYEFQSVAAGTTYAEITENTAGNPNQVSGTSATVAHGNIVTTGAERLGLAFVAIAANQAASDFTGESGGDLTEAAEFASATGTTGTIQLQTAAIAAPGTITGGTFAITSDDWAVITTALLPAQGPFGYRRIVGPVAFGTSAATLYTVPTGTRARVRKVYVNNPSGAEIEFTLSVGTDAAGTRLLDQHAVAADDAYNSRRAMSHTLVAGETIQGFADSTAAVVVIDAYLESI